MEKRQKLFSYPCRLLIFFPDDTGRGFKGRQQRAKAQLAVPGGVNQMVEADGIAKPFFNQQRTVEQKRISGDDI